MFLLKNYLSNFNINFFLFGFSLFFIIYVNYCIKKIVNMYEKNIIINNKFYKKVNNNLNKNMKKYKKFVKEFKKFKNNNNNNLSNIPYYSQCNVPCYNYFETKNVVDPYIYNTSPFDDYSYKPTDTTNYDDLNKDFLNKDCSNKDCSNNKINPEKSNCIYTDFENDFEIIETKIKIEKK